MNSNFTNLKKSLRFYIFKVVLKYILCICNLLMDDYGFLYEVIIVCNLSNYLLSSVSNSGVKDLKGAFIVFFLE